MATRYVKCSYQEVVDLHTESDKVTAIGIHTPTGDTPRKMFKGYFDQYKKYKYRGASIKFVPAARLPADLEGVSYVAGDPGVDPRDLMNPILVHGCHGNDMGTILNRLYGDNNELSDALDILENPDTSYLLSVDPFYDAMERLYYKALTDTTWKKANVQRGFVKTNLRPLVYSLAVNHQIQPGFELDQNGGLYLSGGLPTNEYSGSGTSSDADVVNSVDNNNIRFFTPRLMRLGWMDTRNVITQASTVEGVDLTDLNSITSAIHQGLVQQVKYASLDKLFMLMILLPPAYKTEVHFRAIITHHFAFKDFRGISFMPEQTGVPTYHGYEWDSIHGAEVPVSFPDISGVSSDPDAPSSGGGSLGGDPSADAQSVTVTNHAGSNVAYTMWFQDQVSTFGGDAIIGRSSTSTNLPSVQELNPGVYYVVMAYNSNNSIRYAKCSVDSGEAASMTESVGTGGITYRYSSFTVGDAGVALTLQLTSW